MLHGVQFSPILSEISIDTHEGKAPNIVPSPKSVPHCFSKDGHTRMNHSERFVLVSCENPTCVNRET
jgi:hypothetical protein